MYYVHLNGKFILLGSISWAEPGLIRRFKMAGINEKPFVRISGQSFDGAISEKWKILIIDYHETFYY